MGADAAGRAIQRNQRASRSVTALEGSQNSFGATTWTNNLTTGIQEVPADMRFSRMYVEVTSNTADRAVRYALRVNGVESALQVVVPAGTSGSFEVNEEVLVNKGDNIQNTAIVTTTTGSGGQFAGVSYLYEVTES
jgi:hypothetical protein